MKRFVLTPSAKRDVNEIWDYPANDSIEAAGRVLAALASAMLTPRQEAGHRSYARGVGRQTATLLCRQFVSNRLPA